MERYAEQIAAAVASTFSLTICHCYSGCMILAPWMLLNVMDDAEIFLKDVKVTDWKIISVFRHKIYNSQRSI